MAVTTSNTHTIPCIYQDTFTKFIVVKKPRLVILIYKLVNTAIEGLTEGFLGHDYAIQLKISL